MSSPGDKDVEFSATTDVDPTVLSMEVLSKEVLSKEVPAAERSPVEETPELHAVSSPEAKTPPTTVARNRPVNPRSAGTTSFGEVDRTPKNLIRRSLVMVCFYPDNTGLNLCSQITLSVLRLPMVVK